MDRVKELAADLEVAADYLEEAGWSGGVLRLLRAEARALSRLNGNGGNRVVVAPDGEVITTDAEWIDLIVDVRPDGQGHPVEHSVRKLSMDAEEYRNAVRFMEQHGCTIVAEEQYEQLTR